MLKVEFPEYVDSSMLSTYKSCPAKFFRTYLQHWKPKGLSVHLVAGKAFAAGLEATRKAFYEQGQDKEAAIAAGLMKLITSYGDFECPPDSAKSLERMCGAFEFYWDNYELSHDPSNSPVTMPNGRRGIEFSFSEPIDVLHPTTGNPLLYVGRMDAIYNFAGDVYIIDEKTTTQLGASWSRQWDLRGQFTGYKWGCDRAGIRVGGAIVRGVSILKTKYDTAQAITYRPDWQVSRWYDETCSWISAMVADFQSGRYLHNLGDSCADFGGCALMRVCTSESPQNWLETYFERRKWNPVLHEETVLLADGET